MRICFSRDRPAQLDLLLRSLDRYAPIEETVVLYRAGSGFGGPRDFRLGYQLLEPPDWVTIQEQADFDADVRQVLASVHPAEAVTFFCDDDVVFRPIPDDPREYLKDPNVLAFSWRLGHSYLVWRWADLPRTGHGYPGSIDGHTFRTSDVQEMIGSQVIENPTMLETVLALGCERLADRRPLMAAWPEQVLVGVPVNRVSETSGCPNGERFPQPVEELNRRFLAGERIALDRLDFSGVDGCHHEIQYEWE